MYKLPPHSFSETYNLSTFPYKSRRSRSNQGHHMKQVGNTRVTNAAYQVSRSSAFRFQKRRFLKIISIYGHGGHLGHVTWTIWTHFHSPIQWRLHQKFNLGIPVMRYERAVRPCALNFRLAALKCRLGRPPNTLSSVGVWPSMPPLCASFIQNVITLTGHLFIGKKCGLSKHSYLSINLKLFR